MLKALSIAFIVFSIWLVRKTNGIYHRIEKERFERRNSAGVMVFDSYEESVHFEKRASWNLFFMMASVGAVILAIFFALFAWTATY